MPQFGRPTTDTTRTNWAEDDDTTTSIFDQIDEVTADDVDYIHTPAPPGTNVYVTELTNLTDPAASTGHVVRVRHSKDAAAGATVNLTVQLRQAYVSEGSQGTLIATPVSAVALSDAWTTTAYTLSAAEADAITDYNSLFLRAVATQV